MSWHLFINEEDVNIGGPGYHGTCSLMRRMTTFSICSGYAYESKLPQNSDMMISVRQGFEFADLF